MGSRELRSAIAQRYTDRGVATNPDQVMVTTGAQSAIHLLARVLIRRGERALIETPTYPHAAEALRSAGARLVGVPVTVEDGWDLDRAAQAFARAQPSFAYLMPTFQNPTGRCMTPGEQATIADAAARAGAVVVIDETTGELAIDAAAPGAAFADHDVVRIGSLGKAVWGGLRIGWIRARPELIRRLIATRPTHDLGTPEFEQAIATRLLPLMPEILRQRAELLRAGRDELVGALTSGLPEWRVPHAAGGVSLWVELDAPLSSSLVITARSEGLLLSAGARFAVDGGHDRRLRVPFTAPVEQLRRAAGILVRCWPDVRAAAPTSHADLLDAVV